MKKSLFSLIILLCIGTAFSQTVFKDYVDGQVYVKFSSSALKSVSKENPNNIPIAKFESLASVLKKYGVTKAYKPFYHANDDSKLPYVVKFEFSQTSFINAFIEDLKKNSGIEFAEKVPLMKTDATPNDFSISSASVHLNQINAQNAWNIFNGNSNIVVAIVDNAVMWSHADLVANTYTNAIEAAGTNGVDDDGNGYVDDINGYDVADNDNNAIPTNTLMDHGTHCAGIAGARTDNSVGIASIGWNIKILPVKCTYSSTSSIDNGYGGIIYAVKGKARVISCSWGGSGSSIVEQSVVDYAWNRGCIVIAAAGNNGTNVQNYPGAYNNVYCVANVDVNNVKASSSSFGTWVDICAPGQNIFSTLPSATTGSYGFKSGTSMATPMVAGLAGLMLSRCPFMTQTNVLNCISSTAVNIYSIAANSTYTAGSQLGIGRIEAFLAMTCAASFTAALPVANFYAFPLYSCPNTPVNFSDSSLYQPTTWNWSFQGGTPATSTSSNPSVQWSTAGTYSVSLTVTNSNGSNTKTKLSYVTIAGPMALPLSEGYQAVQFLPNNWSSKNIMNDNIYWARKSGPGGFGTSNACAFFDNYNLNAVGDRDEMRTPKYVFSNVASARLRFDVAYARYDATNSDTLEVKLSTNCGTSWTSIYLKGGTALATAPDILSLFTPNALQWRKDTIDISVLTANQGNVMFSFINHGQYGQPIYLDNINLAFPTPTLNVSPMFPICAGTAVTLTNTSVSAGSYTWNFPGGTPAVSNLTNPSVSFSTPGVYIYTLTASNGTSTAAITRSISIVGSPTLSVNTPTICNGSVAVCTLTGASSYTWNPGNINGAIVSISPSSTTIYTVVGSNGSCSSTINPVVVVNPNPTVSVTNQIICIGGTATLTASGANSYVWSTGSTNSFAIVSPTSIAVYTVTGTSFGCSDTKTVSVAIGPGISVSASANPPSICSFGNSTISASGASSYSWSTGSTSNSVVVSPSVTTNYTLTGINGSCVASTVITLSVAANPTVNLSAAPVTSICSGATATLTATGASTYSWSTGGTGNLIFVSPSVTTVYAVTGTSLGCSNTQTISVAVGNSSVSLLVSSSSPSICAGSSATISANGVSSYTWNNGANTSSIVVSPSVTTNYTITGANGACQGNAVTTITVVPIPTISLAALPGTVICTGGTATLNASGATSYSWNTGATGNSLLVSPTTTTVYSATGSNAGCSASQTIGISVGASSLSISLTANPPSACIGVSSTISASGASSYTWSTGSNASSIIVTPSTTTTYSLIGSNGTCSGNAITTVSIGSIPNINLTAQPIGSICAGGAATLNATGASTYSWSTGATGASILVNPSATTVYTVTGSNFGCSTTQTVSVSVGNSSIALSVSANPAFVCSGGSSTISAGGASTYTWSNGSNAALIVVSPSVTTTYTLQGSNGTCVGYALATLSITQAPSLSLSIVPSNTLCLGMTATLSAMGSYSNFVWTNPSITNSSIAVTPTASISYTVSASGSVGGCSTKSVVAITLTTNPLSVLSTSNSNCGSFCSGIVNANTSGGTAPYTYSLASGACSTMPCYNLCAGLYNLITKDANGCTSSNIFSIANGASNLLASMSSTNVSCVSCADGILKTNVNGGAAPYTYTWAPSGGNSATASSLTAGCYTVTVKDASGCSVNSMTCIGIGVGLQTGALTSSALYIYPNPAKNLVNIEYQGSVFNYVVYNNLGQVICYGNANQNTATLNLEAFAKGIYLVEVEIGTEKLRKKLVLE